MPYSVCIIILHSCTMMLYQLIVSFKLTGLHNYSKFLGWWVSLVEQLHSHLTSIDTLHITLVYTVVFVLHKALGTKTLQLAKNWQMLYKQAKNYSLNQTNWTSSCSPVSIQYQAEWEIYQTAAVCSHKFSPHLTALEVIFFSRKKQEVTRLVLEWNWF